MICVAERVRWGDFFSKLRVSSGIPHGSRYALGILDRKSGILRYSEVEGGQIIRIEPRAHSLNYTATKSGIVTEPEDKVLLAQKNRRSAFYFCSL